MFNQKMIGTCLLVLLAAPLPLLPQAAPSFFARHYSGKCLDFGAPPQVPGSPVFLYGCNGTISQQIVVQEINQRHEVILHAGSQVIAVKETPPDRTGGASSLQAGATPTPETPLELESEARSAMVARRQILALDGDSIILAADHNLVVKTPSGREANRTPLVLGQRDLADREFWTFSAIDRKIRKLTSGFVRVPHDTDLITALSSASWGTVIEIAAGPPIDLTKVL